MKRIWWSVLLLTGVALGWSMGDPGVLTVDFSATLRPATHSADGSLYGVTEKLPADIGSLVAPLNPAVFTAPALAGPGYQQPFGAAIPVAARLASTSGRVMIRLADLCPNWPYSFPGMGAWLDQVASFIQAKKASGLGNFYGYELWNEPNATWNPDNGDFKKTLWLRTFQKVRALDPGLPIVGPSFSEYNHGLMEEFLSFAKNANCLPEIVSWHELGGGGGAEVVSAHQRDYRALEASLGISPRRVSINEYCDPDHSLEGQPGSSARYIGKFERYQVDSACISWWFTGLPGRLGSLLTRKPTASSPLSNGQGGGWWLYRWYGEMTGDMVRVTPPDDDSDGVDGFANLDAVKNTASVCLGGPTDGNLTVELRHIPAAWGGSVQIIGESVGWVSKDRPVEPPSEALRAVVTPGDGTVTVQLKGLKNAYGYRLVLSPGTGAGTPSPLVVAF